MDTDTIISLPHMPSDADSEIESPQATSSGLFPPHSPNSTASTSSTSGPYTPPSNPEYDIGIQGVATNSDSLAPSLSDPVVLLEAHKPYGLLLHTCLTTSNPVQWDMLIDPKTPFRPHALAHDFMTHHAFPDPVSKMQISCELLPWPIIIDINQEADHSPRIEDIFESIHIFLWKLVSSQDFENQTAERQHRIKKAYQRRYSQSSAAGGGVGLRRIDFLDDQTMFLGLSPGDNDDEWRLHVGKEY